MEIEMQIILCYLKFYKQSGKLISMYKCIPFIFSSLDPTSDCREFNIKIRNKINPTTVPKAKECIEINVIIPFSFKVFQNSNNFIKIHVTSKEIRSNST